MEKLNLSHTDPAEAERIQASLEAGRLESRQRLGMDRILAVKASQDAFNEAKMLMEAAFDATQKMLDMRTGYSDASREGMIRQVEFLRRHTQSRRPMLGNPFCDTVGKSLEVLIKIATADKPLSYEDAQELFYQDRDRKAHQRTMHL
jgi:hypothetical protein